MPADSIQELYDEIARMQGFSQEYYDKMYHIIPQATVVDRIQFILHRCQNKHVLNIGCTQPLHGAIEQVAQKAWGMDIDNALNRSVKNFIWCDLDKVHTQPPTIPSEVDVVIFAEVIEHLSNPGSVLDWLRGLGVPVVLTTPNAFSNSGAAWVQKSIELVNREHVCWYSWYTLTNLVRRHGFEVAMWGWYGGNPRTSEGLVMVII